MSTFQFSLFFAALLICYGLAHVRLMRFEAHVRQLNRLEGVEGDIHRLVETLSSPSRKRLLQQLETLQPEVIAGHVEQMRGEMQLLREVASVMSRQLEEIDNRLEHVALPPVSQPVILPGPDGGPDDRLRALIETRLLSLGYSRVRILTDFNEIELSGEVEVTVECEQNQIPCKGRVVVHNGSVLEVQMQSTTQSFP